MTHLLAVVSIVCLALVYSCTSHQAPQFPNPNSESNASIFSEIEQQSTPAGVDPDVYAELKDELIAQLAARDTQKSSSATPPDDGYQLALAMDEGTSTLSWLYYNRGDFDQNGEVNAADLTPLGLKFAQRGDFPYESALSVVDGDGNGEINISDVTPVAANFKKTVVGYNVFSSMDPADILPPDAGDSEIDPIGFVAMADGAGEPNANRLAFSFVVETPINGHYFWVRPTNGETEGTPSLVAGGGNIDPIANLVVAPWPGLPYGADFDGAASTDPDGTIVEYRVDIDNDGTDDYTGSGPLFNVPIPTPGSWEAVLTVVDNLGGEDSVTVPYEIPAATPDEGMLDSNGGTLQLANVEIQVDPGVVLGPLDLTAHETRIPDGLPAGFVPGGPAIDLMVSDEGLLNSPLIMTFPYDDAGFGDEDNMSVLLYDAALGYSPTTFLAIDRVNNRVTVDARRFGIFVVAWFDLLQVPSVTTADGFYVTFDPTTDGWNINNFGEYFSPGGNCLGMSGYATWFWTDRPFEDLIFKFSMAGGNPVSIAHLMCARAHLAQSQYWAKVNSSGQLQNEEWLVGLTMKIYLKTFEEPLILLMLKDGKPRHACVVYGWDATGFLFYDVNSTGVEQHLDFTSADGFGTYGANNNFGFVTDPSMGRAEDFNQLTAEGENGFLSSQDINLTSPLQNQDVAGYYTQVAGTLGGGLTDEIDLIAYVNGTTFNIPVTAGSFSTFLPIIKGPNTIVLIAGATSQSLWKRNGATLIRNINGKGNQVEIQVSSMWNHDLSDLDLYVVEPAGPPVWPGQQRSENELTMRLSNDMGYGPEQVTLSNEAGGSIVPGDYLVRVHYNEDLGDITPTGPVSGEVTIVLNHGTGMQTFQTIPFNIPSANPENTGYQATGPDWADIATFNVATGEITLF